MGVTGLWKLIEPCGKPVPVETLEGKILAVDISIWLHQVVKGFQDNKGSALNNAHLLGLFHRLCKLLYYRVRPVFIFDGCVPQLKRDTIARRQQQRSKLNNEADRIQALLLQALAKEKVVQQALGTNAELLLKSPAKPTGKARKNNDDDMFKLPELPAALSTEYNEDDNDQDDGITTSDSSFDESTARHAYNASLQAIDVRSQHFRSLPADIRHEILTDIKETRKQSSWGRLHELPARSNEFCSFQMKRLLKRRAVQESLEEAQKEMGGHTLSYTELCEFFNEEGIVTPTAIEQNTRQICSDEHTRFLLVRDLKKKSMNDEKKLKCETIVESPQFVPPTDEKPCTSAQAAAAGNAQMPNENERAKLGTEYDTDLALALALSLEESNKVYDEKDYEYDADQNLKLNREQSEQLRHAAKGPARSYMIEYGGMNDDEVDNIMDATQLNDTQSLERLLNISIGSTSTSNTAENSIKVVQKLESEHTALDSVKADQVYTIDTDTDSDFEEVLEESTTKSHQILNGEKPLEIHVDTNGQLDPTDDLFADIFENKSSSHDDSALSAIGVQKNMADTDDEDGDFIEVKESQQEVLNAKHDCDKQGNVVTEKETAKLQCIGDDEFIEIKSSGEIQEDLRIEHKTTKQTKTPISGEVLGSILSDLKKQADEIKSLRLTKQEKESDTAAERITSKLSEVLPTVEPKAEQDEANELKPKPVLSSILADLRRQTDEIKNIKLTNTEQPNIKTSKEPPAVLDAILEELKQQTQQVKNIKFERIKLSDSAIIELSSDDEPSKVSTIGKSEIKDIIELCDSDDNQQKRKTSNKTPSKSTAITDYFETSYVIKRTPDKSPAADVTPPTTPKIAKPFYVKRTPKSARKRAAGDEHSDDSISPNKKTSKAAKSLFVPSEQAQPKPLDTEQMIQVAADSLKSQNTTEELQAMANDLADERRQLESERNRQDRMGMTISQRMNMDCQELLRLFGIPYIVAPMEAEAQCAFLNAVELTQGTITDDSDIWLFGGRTVYKNFFAQNKHVLEFRAEQIEQTFNCNRNKLIQLACLVGSDYTTGIHGIGAVTALEILASFSGAAADASSSTMQSVLSTLVKFRDWWQVHRYANQPPGSSARLSLRKKLKNIELHEGFPSLAVVEAYLTPKVDENRDAFSWGLPDVESIREFARRTFGWTKSKTDDILMPVMKKINDKKLQGSIRNYFHAKSALRVQQPKVSKRVQTAIDRMSGKIDAETPEKPKRPARGKRSKASAAIAPTATAAAAAEKVDEQTADNSKPSRPKRGKRKVAETATAATDVGSATSDAAAKSAKCPRIPNAKQVIPQRERDLEQMRQNKLKAAEILKRTSKN